MARFPWEVPIDQRALNHLSVSHPTMKRENRQDRHEFEDQPRVREDSAADRQLLDKGLEVDAADGYFILDYLIRVEKLPA